MESGGECCPPGAALTAMRLYSTADYAYLAGILDGEGYIGIAKHPAPSFHGRVNPFYRLCVAVRMSSPEPISLFVEVFGGNSTLVKPHKSSPQHRVQYCFQRLDLKAEQVLRSLQPYIRAKREHVEIGLEFCCLKATAKEHRTKLGKTYTFRGNGGTDRTRRSLLLSDDYLAQMESLYWRSRRLSIKGSGSQWDEDHEGSPVLRAGLTL